MTIIQINKKKNGVKRYGVIEILLINWRLIISLKLRLFIIILFKYQPDKIIDIAYIPYTLILYDVSPFKY